MANDNKDSGASDSEDIKSDVNNVKVCMFLSKFIDENTIYIQTDQRSNINNNGDAAGNRMDNTAAAINTGKKDHFTSNNSSKTRKNRFNDMPEGFRMHFLISTIRFLPELY